MKRILGTISQDLSLRWVSGWCPIIYIYTGRQIVTPTNPPRQKICVSKLFGTKALYKPMTTYTNRALKNIFQRYLSPNSKVLIKEHVREYAVRKVVPIFSLPQDNIAVYVGRGNNEYYHLNTDPNSWLKQWWQRPLNVLLHRLRRTSTQF